MDSSLTFVIPVDIHPFTKNAITWKVRGQWSCADYRSKLERAQHLARREWVREGQPTVSGKVRVDVHIARTRMLDEGNIWWGMAGFLDGLFIKGVTRDDSPRYVKLGDVTQHIDSHLKGREYIRVVVTPINGDQKELF